MERPRLTKDWHVVTDVPAPGWVQVIGPAFKVDGPTTATDLNGEDYMDRHRDARRIARVPEMEAEILRLRAELATTRRHALQDAADACRARADMITAFDMDCCEGTANNCASDIEALMEEPSHD